MMNMEYRFATEEDLDLLSEWNYQLITDEGHHNTMTVPELRDRMKEWLLNGGYKAVIFGSKKEPVAYALYRETESEV
jgi:hypothetical protein